MSINLRIGAALIVVWLQLLPNASAQALALVTDVSGQAVLVESTQRVQILTEIHAGTRVRLDTAARMVALYPRSGVEYSFVGPSQIEFQPGGPSMQSGSPPEQRPSLLGRTTIKPAGVTQAAFVMRSGAANRIKLLSPGLSMILQTNPEFRWQHVQGVRTYRFQLLSERGDVIWEHDTDDNQLKLPTSVFVDNGKSYMWAVTARSPDGHPLVGSGSFGVADATLRNEVERLRPISDAPVSDRVAFAAWLAGIWA